LKPATSLAIVTAPMDWDAVAEVATSLAIARVVSECVLTERAWSRPRALSWAALAVLLAQGCRSLRLSLASLVHRPHLLATKVSLLVLCHAVGCAIDCRTHVAFRWRDFLACLSQAALYVAPVISTSFAEIGSHHVRAQP
jgi:hypothetical protein